MKLIALLSIILLIGCNEKKDETSNKKIVEPQITATLSEETPIKNGEVKEIKNKPLIMDGRRILQHRYANLQENGFNIIAVGSPLIRAKN